MADRKFLVAYSTRYGSTTDVAQAIGEGLAEAGAEVDVRPAGEVTSVRDYDAAVIGSPLYAGNWLGAAKELVTRERDALLNMPVAYFVVGLAVKQDTEESREYMMNSLKSLPQINPVTVGLFGGSDQHLPFLLKGLVRLIMRGSSGDLRDREAARQWAREVASQLAAT